MKVINYKRDPSVVAYMLRAFYPSRGFDQNITVPKLKITQEGFKFDSKKCRSLFNLTQMEMREELPIFFPQVLGFRLVMRAVTDPDFPEPIWNALQIRNEIKQYRPLFINDIITFELGAEKQRAFEKGVEVDFKMIVKKNNESVWESITTFYYRGKFKPNKESQLRPPNIENIITKKIRMQTSGGLSYGCVSGDFNGIHLFSPYAKLFGFSSAFLHPHRVVGATLNKVEQFLNSYPQKLDLWFRGPVPYGIEVSLAIDKEQNESRFAVFANDERPSIVGRLSFK